MFKRLGVCTYRHAKLILVSTLVVILVASFLGAPAFGKLKSGGFDDPKAESSQAADLMGRHFDGRVNFILLIHTKEGTVDTATVASKGRALAASLGKQANITNMQAYWSTASPFLRSKDGTYALITAYYGGSTGETKKLMREYSKQDGPISVSVGGEAAVNVNASTQVKKDLALAEGIAVPLTLLLLVVAFGSLISALLPVAMGIIAILGTFAELSILGNITDVSIYAINLTTALGLGLAIDYGLFMVSRYREELAAGQTVEQAIAKSVATAGRTIVFSAATVAASLAALAIFPLYFLRSFAYAGMGVVVVSALAALIVLPALLAVIGTHIEAGKLPWHRFKIEAPFWRHIAGFVMRRPALTALPVLVMLVICAIPLHTITFGSPDDKILPTSASARKVNETLAAKFSVNQSNQMNVLIVGQPSQAALAQYADTVSHLTQVQDVRTPRGIFKDGVQISRQPAQPDKANIQIMAVDMLPKIGSESAEAQALVKAVREVSIPNGHVYVGGPSATLVDTKHAIGSRLAYAVLIIASVTFAALFLFTGSIVQPVRALLFNSLTLAATIGIVVWIFQEGHLSSVLRFSAVPTDMAMTMLLFCIAFGLSMDYEVFLLSRIKEIHETGVTTQEAVRHGLARAGRIVSTAAAMLAVSFFAFGTARISFLQLFGIGTGLAILIDATLNRGVLVPASMRVLGERAWYAPKLLKRLQARIGLSEKP